MIHYKMILNNELRLELNYINDKNDWVEEGLENGVYEGYTPEDEITYNYDITIEELEKEFNTQIENVKAKVKEIEDYFNTFKGRVLRIYDAKYNMYQYIITHYKNIGDIPDTINDEADIETLKSIINFKFDPDTVYINKPSLDVDTEYDGDCCSFYGANYKIDTAEFVGLTECEIKNRALKLAVYNKISNIFQLNKVNIENFNMVRDGYMTIKGFIKGIEITNNDRC